MPVIESIYDALGKPSLVSALSALLSFVAIGFIRNNQKRNNFVDSLMNKQFVDKNECSSNCKITQVKIDSIKEEIKQHIIMEKDRLDDIKDQLTKTQDMLSKITFEMIGK